MKKIILIIISIFLSFSSVFGSYVEPKLSISTLDSIITKNDSIHLLIEVSTSETINLDDFNIEGIDNFLVKKSRINNINYTVDGVKKNKTVIELTLYPKKTGNLILGPVLYKDLVSNKLKVEILDTIDKKVLEEKLGNTPIVITGSALRGLNEDMDLFQTQIEKKIQDMQNELNDELENSLQPQIDENGEYIPDGEVDLTNEIIDSKIKYNKLQFLYKVIIGILGIFLLILLGILLKIRKGKYKKQNKNFLIEYPELDDENFIIKLQAVFIYKIENNFNFHIENIEYTKLAGVLDSKKIKVQNIDKICEYFILLKYSNSQDNNIKQELTYLIKNI